MSQEVKNYPLRAAGPGSVKVSYAISVKGMNADVFLPERCKLPPAFDP